jgi:hypothetical protein
METNDPAADLKGWLSAPTVKPHEISQFLDSLNHASRVAAIRSLNRTEQRRLYEAVEGYRPLRLSDLVPATCDSLATVRHFGKNTLPAFSHFEKRFCRPVEADPERPTELLGFNFQTMAPITGPGYFIAVGDEQRDEVLVDYRRVPQQHPDGWPSIKSNERGLSRFVYGFMVDTLRGVSEHVTIGSAARKGKDMGSWFVLCREE